MSKYVLDASALLALLNAETGAGLVQELLPEALISTVNLAEVVTRLALLGMPGDEIRDALTLLGLETVPFVEEQAYRSGFLVRQTQALGLSLGDRACLALASMKGLTVVTADRAWKEAGVEVEVRVIR